jgi:uncharacterized membrane protein
VTTTKSRPPAKTSGKAAPGSPRTSAPRGAKSKTAARPQNSGAFEAAAKPRPKYFGLTLARFFALLSLSLWLGGLFFFGALAAPAMFKISRANQVGELAPQMVSLMLGRFGFITYACGALLLLSWIGEKLLGGVRNGRSQTLWWVQGACSAAMLGIAIYLGTVLMPQIQKMQPQILASVPAASAQSTLKSNPISAQTKTRFDALHQGYSGWAMVTVYLGLATLLSIAWRSALDRD